MQLIQNPKYYPKKNRKRFEPSKKKMLELTETVDLEADSGDSKPIEDMQKQNFISNITKKKKATYNPKKN